MYRPDSNTPAALAQRRGVTELWITPLCLLEFGNALQLSVFRRVMTSAEARLAGSALDDDIAAGLMNLAPFPVPAWEEARHISMAHTRTIGARSLDILQVAAALTLGAPLFLTFDRVQRKLAALVGLRTHGSSLRNVIST